MGRFLTKAGFNPGQVNLVIGLSLLTSSDMGFEIDLIPGLVEQQP